MYNVALQMQKPTDTPRRCLEQICEDQKHMEPMKIRESLIMCPHITFTPTRILLEGPIPTQSNSVIRRYANLDPELLDNFVRVTFADENRLAFRWDNDVDGTYLLRDRVGRILKDGFELGGRNFEFLAYSSSSLREHAVWFMSPFHCYDYDKKGDRRYVYVNSESIRQSLGDFSEVQKQPSKYAARIAQAFTATDFSVKILRDQWEEMDDLGSEPYLHTDGVGTISSELGDMIWAKLCEGRHDHGERSTKPSVVSFPAA